MSHTAPFESELPSAADAAVEIIRQLTSKGHHALLAGGCVRDLLLGRRPLDYDIATDAPPDRICELFRATRRVGAQFGVVLVKKHRRWIEVATFRTDIDYVDGRHPTRIELTDARNDALRRDFTVNGMFLDPIGKEIIDYVGGREDLDARLIRAIGQPEQRFDEDHLRMLRAVRFAAKLHFEMERTTHAAIRANAEKLGRVSAERIREELEKMLSHPARQRAWQLLGECGLRTRLWPEATWSESQARRADELLSYLPPDAPFELAMAVLLKHVSPKELHRIAVSLKLSNQQRDRISWLVDHHSDLDDPAALSLAAFKRLMAHPAFKWLSSLARARHHGLPDGAAREATLSGRIASVRPDCVQPAPFVTGDDLISRGLEPGPLFRRILDRFYTEQLDELINTREEALDRLEQIVQSEDLLRREPE